MYTDRFSPALAVDLFVSTAFVIAWSSGFILAGPGSAAAGALTFLTWRTLLVAGLFIGWAAWRGETAPGARELGFGALIGGLSQTVYLGGAVGAVALGVPAGTAALIAAGQPLVVAVAAPLVGERVRPRDWAGLGIGLVGVVVVVGGDLGAARGVPTWAYLLPLASMLALAAATLLQRRRDSTTTIAQSLGVETAAAAGMFLLVALAFGRAVPAADLEFSLAVVASAVSAGAGGYGFYWLAAKRFGASGVSSLIYLTPATTAVWAALALGDPLPLTTVAGLGISLAGLSIIRPRSSAGGAPVPEPARVGGSLHPVARAERICG